MKSKELNDKLTNPEAYVFYMVYSAFELRSDPRVKLASMVKPPFTDTLLITNYTGHIETRSTESDLGKTKDELEAGLDNFYDIIVPGGRDMVHETVKHKPTKTHSESHQDIHIYRISTVNPQIELVLVRTADDRSYTWDFQLERKQDWFNKAIGGFASVFNHAVQPPDRF